MFGLSGEQAVSYIKVHGVEKMSTATYYRTLQDVEAHTLKRLNEIARKFKENHMQEMDELAEIEKLMWDNYTEEEDPTRKVQILKEIVSLKPYKTAFIDATREMMEEHAKEQESANFKGIDLSNLGA